MNYARALVSSDHFEYSVRVEFKSNLNLGNAAGRRRYALEVELAEQVVVLCHGTLALVHLYPHDGLIVGRRRKATVRQRACTFLKPKRRTSGSLALGTRCFA
jgi:xanthine/CO dehydrogenase XdhC/CoxF family maturation factor